MVSLLLILGLACAFAAPTPETYLNTKSFDSISRGIQYSPANTKILRQINEHNEDGSYTFGYESEDGSFRIENKDVDGLVTGKYGYIDANGEPQEFEYVAGSVSGRSLGYRVQGSPIPESGRSKEFPTTYPSMVSVDLKDRDYGYSSTDVDYDGFPDKMIGSLAGRNQEKSNVVRLANTQVQTPSEDPSNIVRLTSSVQTSAENPSSPVRLTLPNRTSPKNPSNVIRVASLDQTFSEDPLEMIELANPARVPAETSNQKASGNPSSTVRFANPAQFSNQRQVFRLTAPKKRISFQPTRVSSGGYQVIKQDRLRQSQFVQPVFGPSYNANNGRQRFVSRSSSPLSSGRLDPFLDGQANIVRDNYGRWTIRGNDQQARFAPSVQTIFIDEDDFDDVNEFDNDVDDDDYQYFTTI